MEKVTFLPFTRMDGRSMSFLFDQKVGYAGKGEVLTSAYYDGERFLLMRDGRPLVLVEDREASFKMLTAWSQRAFDKVDFYDDRPEVLSDSQIKSIVEDVLSVRTLG